MLAGWTPEYFVRYLDLPIKVEGVTIPNDDGTFDIYINKNIPPAVREDVLKHEIRHIIRDHFYRSDPVAVCEIEADGQRNVRELQDVFSSAPPQKIPYFSSLDTFGQYMFAMRKQVHLETDTPRR